MASFASSTTTGGARKHAWTNLKNSNIQYHCNQCDYKAKCKGYLKAHIRKIHAKVENSSSFFYTLCDYKAKKKIKLMEHFSRQHKHTDKYRCDECDFTTHNNVNLVRHMERVFDIAVSYVMEFSTKSLVENSYGTEA